VVVEKLGTEKGNQKKIKLLCLGIKKLKNYIKLREY